ncbi:SAM-dependent methyltransferase [Dactylosporangium sp. NPDC000244]|uniref:SAM-dependent methyltransferase n=1 Tax=Dactylosporangium sp. NPDC000244 TaxID=3154365 RepID=UPI00332F0885
MVDVYVCGSGVRLPDHLTIEVLRALDACSTIFSIWPDGYQVLLPEGLRARFRSLMPLYRPGELRDDTYALQVDAIVSAARADPPVAYLTPGNPMVFDSVAQGLLAAGDRLGLSIEILAGVSSIDTILVDLRRDAAPGLQIYEASTLLIYQLQPRTDIACLLMQPNAFGTVFVASDRQPTALALRPLRDYLLRFYPAEHLVWYVSSSMAGSREPQLDCFVLGDLGGTESAPQEPGRSLYLPPARPLAIDAQYADGLADPRRLTEPYRRPSPP